MDNNNVPGLKSLTRIKSPPTIWLRVTHGCTKSTGPLTTSPPPKCGAKFFPRLPLNLASSPPSQNESQSSTAHLSSLEPAPPDTIKTRSKPPKIEVNPQIYSPILVWTLIIFLPSQIYARVFSFHPRIFVEFGHTSAGWKKLHRISSENLKRGQPKSGAFFK